MTYENNFVKVDVNNAHEAFIAVKNMCSFYCTKNEIGRYYCSLKDALECDNLKSKILNDWKGD